MLGCNEHLLLCHAAVVANTALLPARPPSSSPAGGSQEPGGCHRPSGVGVWRGGKRGSGGQQPGGRGHAGESAGTCMGHCALPSLCRCVESSLQTERRPRCLCVPCTTGRPLRPTSATSSQQSLAFHALSNRLTSWCWRPPILEKPHFQSVCMFVQRCRVTSSCIGFESITADRQAGAGGDLSGRCLHGSKGVHDHHVHHTGALCPHTAAWLSASCVCLLASLTSACSLA